ncbi:isocitrate dehydrogenase [Kosakonia radicincitans]|uniref:6-carboxytetrahydropterin synthase n=1 Tax=Kosakonia radicincitans TaxID=283686 RepID=UPI0011ED9A58|nr:6-carboxytetrahydropterin synthase [Kosakonia radicincitans]QEM91005.1 isocitrate dehydrogenase [Kosakonia radicincitans]
MKLFVNNLTVVDCSILNPETGMVGDSFIVDVILEGGLNSEGMVMDFSLVKKTVKRKLDNMADHVLIVPVANNNININQSGLNVDVALLLPGGLTKCFISGPAESFLLINAPAVSQEGLEQLLEKHLMPELPTEIKGIKVKLRREAIIGESYQYSHGLKKHSGNCQRIAHGHRSAIYIYVDGQRNQHWENYWGGKWNNCYLVTEEDISPVEHLSPRARAYWHQGLIASSYRGSQGYFEAMTLKGDTDILPCDTTVESLALFIKSTMHSFLPDAAIEVHAFEGVGKGAIA